MLRRLVAAASVLVVTGCPADEGDSTGEGATSSVGSTTSTSGSTSTSTGSSGASSEASTDEPPVLDVAGTEGDMSRGPYEPCIDDSQCMEGLECLPIGAAAGSPTSHCSTTCTDAESCPEHAGGAPVGCLASPLQPQMDCAVLCEMGECPEPLTCWNPQLDGAPCVPS